MQDEYEMRYFWDAGEKVGSVVTGEAVVDMFREMMDLEEGDKKVIWRTLTWEQALERDKMMRDKRFGEE